MTKVYIVSCFYWNEGCTNIAVYDSKIKAQTYGEVKYDEYVKDVKAVSCEMKIEEFEILT